VFDEEIEACHSEEHKQGVRAAILGEADVIGHKGQREGAEKGNERRKLSCKEIDHRDGKGSEDQGDDSEVSFGLGEGIELVGENEKKRRVKISRILLIIVKLTSKIISRIIEGVDFVHPERFSIKGVESEGKPCEKAQNDDNNFFSNYIPHNRESQLLYLSIQLFVSCTQPLLPGSQSLSVSPS
jgi:hypothetical protein